MSSVETKDIAVDLRAGSDESLAIWRERIRSLASNRIGNDIASRVDTSDVTQEVLIQVWRDSKQLRADSEVQRVAWLRRIVDRQAARLGKHHRAKKRAGNRESHDRQPVPDRQRDPQQCVQLTEEMQHLVEVMERLDATQRDVVMLYFFEHQSFNQIAAGLNTTPRIVRGIYARAIKRIRQLMG